MNLGKLIFFLGLFSGAASSIASTNKSFFAPELQSFMKSVIGSSQWDTFSSLPNNKLLESVKLPKSVDLSPFFSDYRSQGQTKTCVAHAITSVMEALYFQQTGERIFLSPHFLHESSQFIHNAMRSNSQNSIKDQYTYRSIIAGSQLFPDNLPLAQHPGKIFLEKSLRNYLIPIVTQGLKFEDNGFFIFHELLFIQYLMAVPERTAYSFPNLMALRKELFAEADSLMGWSLSSFSMLKTEGVLRPSLLFYKILLSQKKPLLAKWTYTQRDFNHDWISLSFDSTKINSLSMEDKLLFIKHHAIVIVGYGKEVNPFSGKIENYIAVRDSSATVAEGTDPKKYKISFENFAHHTKELYSILGVQEQQGLWGNKQVRYALSNQ